MNIHKLDQGNRCLVCGTALRSEMCTSCDGTGTRWKILTCKSCGGSGQQKMCPERASHLAPFSLPRSRVDRGRKGR
jgi:DnaJ-class molecular chaperone